MFDQFKQMQALAGLLKNKEGLRDAGERIKAKVERLRVEGEAGAGACRAIVTGKMRVESIELSAGLLQGMAVDERTRDLAAALVRDAVNDGLERAQAAIRSEVEREAAALGLEGLGGQLGGLLT